MLIYKITNKTNGKCYIGQTTQSLNRRLSGHRDNRTTNPISRAIREYGIEAFTIEALAKTYDRELGELLEIEYIKKFKACNPENGYNIRQGGINGTYSAEFRKTMNRHMVGNTYRRGVKLPKSVYSFRLKPISCSNGKVYESAKAAAIELDLWEQNIGKVALGKLPRTGGLKFWFTEKV